jgi:hypothetical protein
VVRAYDYRAPNTFFDQSLNYVSDGFTTLTTIAGSTGVGNTDATGAAAAFENIAGEVIVGNNLYLTDSGNSSVRQVDLTTFAVTTLSGSPTNNSTYTDGAFATATFRFPTGITAVGSSTLYVLDNACIRQLDLVGKMVTTVVGSCANPGAVNAAGVQARLGGGGGLVNDGTYIYLGDSGNNMIRKIALNGFAVTTLAGQRTAGFADLTGTAAKFNQPGPVALLNGKLYVADYVNEAVREVDLATGMVTTLAGGKVGLQDGTGSAARFEGMDALTTDGTDLFLVDGGNYIVRRIVSATGTVRLLAGVVNDTSPTDGPILTAGFPNPLSITYSGTLGLLVGGNDLVRVH